MSPDERRAAIKDSRAELHKLLEGCEHRFRPLSEEELADLWMSTGAWCDVCHYSFGWRCKISPDSVCHYFSVDQGGKLSPQIDGDPVTFPQGEYGGPDSESDDWCLFCGMPEERK